MPDYLVTVTKVGAIKIDRAASAEQAEQVARMLCKDNGLLAADLTMHVSATPINTGAEQVAAMQVADSFFTVRQSGPIPEAAQEAASRHTLTDTYGVCPMCHHNNIAHGPDGCTMLVGRLTGSSVCPCEYIRPGSDA